MTYAELIGELFPRLHGGIRWGLEKTERLLTAVGNPQRAFRSVHIGGTNGKGSVAATVASVLGASGHRVGLYTSPHLCTFRERIQIAGSPISESALEAAASRLWPAIEREDASFFEATTALAFLAFAEAGVEVVVAEVGLGGRLDSTNVLTPDLVILTEVAIDHVDQLGTALQSIGEEKAGIIKPGVPVVTGARSPEIQEIFGRRAAELGSTFRLLDDSDLTDIEVGLDGTSFRFHSELWHELKVQTPLIGTHQAWNAALAILALEALPADLRPEREELLAGIRGVHWPGRLQRERIEGRDWIFDVAHNPAGVAALMRTLDTLPIARPLVAVVGVMADKDWRSILSLIAHSVEEVVLTRPPSAPAGRAWDPAEALVELRSTGCGALGRVETDFGRALRVAREAAGDGTVLVAGSFHTVGDALTALGLAPAGSDPILPPRPTPL